MDDNIEERKIAWVNGKNKTLLASNMKVGDYISYTPSDTSCELKEEATGARVDEVINLAELTVWRVVRKIRMK